VLPGLNYLFLQIGFRKFYFGICCLNFLRFLRLFLNMRSINFNLSRISFGSPVCARLYFFSVQLNNTGKIFFIEPVVEVSRSEMSSVPRVTATARERRDFLNNLTVTTAIAAPVKSAALRRNTFATTGPNSSNN